VTHSAELPFGPAGASATRRGERFAPLGFARGKQGGRDKLRCGGIVLRPCTALPGAALRRGGL